MKAFFFRKKYIQMLSILGESRLPCPKVERMKIIPKEDFNNFVNSLIADETLQVIGVKAKRDKFVFAPLETRANCALIMT